MKYSLIIVLVVILAACGRNKDKEVLGREEMKLVMWDLLRADEVASIENGKDTVRTNLLQHAVEHYQQVFAIHHISKEQFYNSYKYYQEHPEEHKTLMDSLAAFGERMKQKKDKIEHDRMDSIQKVKHPVDTSKAGKDSAISINRKQVVTDSLKRDSVKRGLRPVIKPAKPPFILDKTKMHAPLKDIKKMPLRPPGQKTVKLLPGAVPY